MPREMEDDWITQEDASNEAYKYYMRNDPNTREFMGPITTEFDEYLGREMRFRNAKVGTVRGATEANMREVKVYLDPVPHLRVDNPKPLQGWYSNKGDGDQRGKRDRPCLLPDSVVHTAFGDKEIQNLQVGDVVFGYNGETKQVCQTTVEAVWSSQKEEYLEIELESGRVLRLTPEHQVFTRTRGWLEAKELTLDDDILPYTSRHNNPGKAPRLCGVYLLKERVSGKVYVGSAVECVERMSRHLRWLRRGVHCNKHLQNAYNVGARFDCLVVEVCPASKLIEREQYYMDFYKSLDNNFGYNLTPAGRTILSEEARSRVAASKLGKTYEEIFKDQFRAKERRQELRNQTTGENNPNYGNRGVLHPNFGKTNVERFGAEEAARLAAITSATHKNKPKSKKQRLKLSRSKKGGHWFNDGVEERFAKTSPGSDFIAGRLPRNSKVIANSIGEQL